MQREKKAEKGLSWGCLAGLWGLGGERGWEVAELVLLPSLLAPGHQEKQYPSNF